ncbi:thioredoxin domain-containing protein [Eleftheria terrae]|uniref:thioredoxin domain-containing protein n=1 Tax=Eleftheria terrae TaxID=1597781 RepID=UPI00263ABCBC|nr:thioredoxin domain-containing protein [Eleftheria terrae]WKB51628.1 thioredoxin domain-containing protein [Eleftheria terrae]
MSHRLALETSPYLRQHAGNPVDWYPWGPQALALARESGRPILLSIGYSACHWCHVMAHDCFEDEDTAALMNRHFVNIKVDREERPDLDHIYQAAHQLIVRRGGGWPLTMFLTPEGEPFFGGTYFPKQPRWNLPGFDQVLQGVADAWHHQQPQLKAQGRQVVNYLLASQAPPPAGEPPSVEDRGQAAAQGLMDSFDAEHGGFGHAPKFPHVPGLTLLLRQPGQAEVQAALLSLRRMAEGGLYDQLGGGFFRYSTDAEWLIPHFEKMLYDNGLLLRLYAEAGQLTDEPLWREVCGGTADWLLREMPAAGGGWCSSIDADAEGEEGRFYVWQRDEVLALLGAPGADAAVFAARYGLDEPPNFEGHAWHLHVAQTLPDVAAGTGADSAGLPGRLRQCRQRLLQAREARVRPARDDKVLTSWNALAIEGLAFAARVFAEPRWAAAARDALAFLRETLWRDGRLMATVKDGHAHLNAYLDDHAFLLGATLEVVQLGPLRHEEVAFARALAEALLARFEDRHEGGFFFTSHDHESLVLRPQAGHDGAIPSGNGVAALQLQRLGHLLGEPRYLAAAAGTIRRFAVDAGQSPQAFCSLALAMGEAAEPPPLVVLTGPPQELAAWAAALARRHAPGLCCVQLPADTTGLPEVLVKPAAQRAQAWICRGPQCLPPVDTLEALLRVLAEPR